MNTFKLGVLSLILIILSGFTQLIYDNNRDYFSEKELFLSLPKTQNLKIISLGFRDIIADLIYIWAIQFYSNYHIKNRFEYVEQIFNLITDLSPQNKDMYHIGSLIMSKEKEDIEMAIRLLLKGAENFPKDYFFYFDAGFYVLWDLKQYERAKKYFSEALAKESTPPKRKLLIKNLIASASYYANDLEASFNEWLKIYQSNESLPHQKKVAQTRLYKIKSTIDINQLDHVITLYKEKFNWFPKDFYQLKKEGYLWNIPKDFFGFDYLYDNKTGKVSSKKTFQIYRIK